MANEVLLQAPTVPPAWESEFADPTLPLHVDIGCGMYTLFHVLYRCVELKFCAHARHVILLLKILMA
jgi:hypothetical protein